MIKLNQAWRNTNGKVYKNIEFVTPGGNVINGEILTAILNDKTQFIEIKLKGDDITYCVHSSNVMLFDFIK